jgi:hypothetical protein
VLLEKSISQQRDQSIRSERRVGIYPRLNYPVRASIIREDRRGTMPRRAGPSACRLLKILRQLGAIVLPHAPHPRLPGGAGNGALEVRQLGQRCAAGQLGDQRVRVAG